MILADKIIDLRKKNGWSQEELAEKLGVSRQSVSKWESGMSVPDLNKIIAMSELFGVSTDYLVKDTLDEPTPSETAARDDNAGTRTVSAEEANRYMDLVEIISKRIALGVALCILSPITLILLGGFSDADVMLGHPAMSEGMALSLGLIVMIMLVACGVAIFIPNGLRLSEFSYLEEECITLEYGVQGIVEKRRDAYRPRFSAMITFGVVVCIVSVLPLLILGVMEAAEITLVGSLGFLMAVCALGVALMVRACYINGSFQKLLQTGDYTEEQKQGRSALQEAISGAYWCLVTGIYLWWSFTSRDWHITWIIWVIAATGQGIIDAIFKRKK